MLPHLPPNQAAAVAAANPAGDSSSASSNKAAPAAAPRPPTTSAADAAPARRSLSQSAEWSRVLALVHRKEDRLRAAIVHEQDRARAHLELMMLEAETVMDEDVEAEEESTRETLLRQENREYEILGHERRTHKERQLRQLTVRLALARDKLLVDERQRREEYGTEEKHLFVGLKREEQVYRPKNGGGVSGVLRPHPPHSEAEDSANNLRTRRRWSAREGQQRWESQKAYHELLRTLHVRLEQVVTSEYYRRKDVEGLRMRDYMALQDEEIAESFVLIAAQRQVEEKAAAERAEEERQSEETRRFLEVTRKRQRESAVRKLHGFFRVVLAKATIRRRRARQQLIMRTEQAEMIQRMARESLSRRRMRAQVERLKIEIDRRVALEAAAEDLVAITRGYMARKRVARDKSFRYLHFVMHVAQAGAEHAPGNVLFNLLGTPAAVFVGQCMTDNDEQVTDAADVPALPALTILAELLMPEDWQDATGRLLQSHAVQQEVEAANEAEDAHEPEQPEGDHVVWATTVDEAEEQNNVDDPFGKVSSWRREVDPSLALYALGALWQACDIAVDSRGAPVPHASLAGLQDYQGLTVLRSSLLSSDDVDREAARKKAAETAEDPSAKRTMLQHFTGLQTLMDVADGSIFALRFLSSIYENEAVVSEFAFMSPTRWSGYGNKEEMESEEQEAVMLEEARGREQIATSHGEQLHDYYVACEALFA